MHRLSYMCNSGLIYYLVIIIKYMKGIVKIKSTNINVQK